MGKTLFVLAIGKQRHSLDMSDVTCSKCGAQQEGGTECVRCGPP